MLSIETQPVAAGDGHVAVEKGYEKALGAALGDDLDAPIDPSSPMHGSEVTGDGGDPALPEGAEPLARCEGANATRAAARSDRRCRA